MLEQTLIEDAMRRALTIARRGPADDVNPQVGCVLVDAEGSIVTEGWHRGSGTPHAEVAALAKLPSEWRSRAHELTAVVTLEPCNHTGRTGPCAVAVAEAGIGTVVYALGDPGAASSGGAHTLQIAGIEVRGGVLETEARTLLGGWLARQGSAPVALPSPATPVTPASALRPHVTVKWAQTLDGRAAAADGSSQWITGPAARADVHRRRAAADAILVGTGTLLADDPSLTARDESGDLLVPAAEQPIPVVLGHREIPAEARVRRHPALAAQQLTDPLQLTGDDLAADLRALADRGIQSVFVEGGPAVASSLIAAGHVDEVLVYVAPALLGGPRLALGDLGIADITGIQRIHVLSTERLGPDLLVRAALDTTHDLEPGRDPSSPLFSTRTLPSHPTEEAL